MLLGLKGNPDIVEKLYSEPNLDFIEKYIGGLIDILELPNNIDIIYDDCGVLNSGGKPTLVLKYSDNGDFDCESDVLIFGNCLFTSHDSLGSSTELNSEQTSFILNNLTLNDKFKTLKNRAVNTGILDGLCLKILDLRSK